jgi:hypothetical protein
MRNVQVLSPTARKVQNFTATPEQIARECLAAAHNNFDRAIALAGRRACGGKLRAAVVAIGGAFLRASAN